MKVFQKSLYPLILVTLFSFIYFNCKVSEKVVALDKHEQQTGLLWRISGNDLANPSYLYGTIHMIPAEDFFLPAGTESAFDTAAILFLEVDMTDMEDPAKQMKLMQQSFMKEDVSLKDLLTDEEYKIVADHFSDKGLPIFFLERIKPIFLTVFADSNINPNSLKDGTLKVYELEFTAMAEDAGMQVKGLESLDFQMSIMDTIPYEYQAEMLLESINNEQLGSSQFDTLVSMYRSQDLTAMVASFDTESISVYDSLLLINRNMNWIPVMQENMIKSSCFFAVGAAHLGGPNGVIRLLEKEGYTLNPVLSE